MHIMRGVGARTPLRLRSAACSSRAGHDHELRIGVLGLGAIGTIFFTRLGLLASSTDQQLPRLQVDAFVKPQQLEKWMMTSRQLKLRGSSQVDSNLSFKMDTQQTAIGSTTSNVRVGTLENFADSKENALDVLLVAVKAYDSVNVLKGLQEKYGHLLCEDALCVLLQNGLGEMPDAAQLGGNRWQFVNGVTFVGGRSTSFGDVLVSGLDAGMTYLAPFAATAEDETQRRDAKVKTLAQVLAAAGINCEVLETSNMQAMLWRKLIVNAAINPIASLLDATNMSVANSEESRHCVRMVVKEALAVAESEQIPLSCTEEELVDDIFDVARNTGSNVCSMLADLRRGSKTEIDAITGRIVAGGQRHNILTPTNDLLLSLVKALEQEGTRRVQD